MRQPAPLCPLLLQETVSMQSSDMPTTTLDVPVVACTKPLRWA